MEKDVLTDSNDPFWWRWGHFLRCLLLVFLHFLVAASDLRSQPYPYKFNYLTVDEGLSHTDANDIAQDKNGYIWVATYFGLSRYDGYAVKRYYNSNTPLANAFKNRMRCVYPDEHGNLWLGTEGGLQYFDVRLEKYKDFEEGGGKANPIFEQLLKPGEDLRSRDDTKSGEDLRPKMNMKAAVDKKPGEDLLYGLTGGACRVFSCKGDTIEEKAVNDPAGVRFSHMVADSDGLVYLTSNHGLWTLDRQLRFKNIPITGLGDADLTTACFNERHQLLVTNVGNLFLLDSFVIVKRFSAGANNYIKSISGDSKGEYWVNTGTEAYRLDCDLQLIQVVNPRSGLRSLNSSALTKLMIDRSGCLWVCTFGGGVNFCDLNEKLFYTLQHNPEQPNSLSGNHIRSILEDGEDLWIGTTADGLNRYNLKTQEFTHYNAHISPVKIENDVVTSLTLDDDRNLWIGTNAGIQILRPDRKQLWTPPGYADFPKYVIETLVKDRFGNIWFGNHMNRFGVIWKDRSNYYHVRYYDEGYYILPDENKPQLFISSTHGLKRVIIDAEGNIVQTFHYKASSSSDGKSLSSDYTYPIARQNDSVWWVGTIGGGLNRLSIDPNDDRFSVAVYGSAFGVFTDVESLEIDNDGNIWMGGNGLECLNPTTGKLIRYDKNDGLQGNSFKVGSSYKGADGSLFFGGINGLNYFYPSRIRPNHIDARPVITDMLINNEKPVFGSGNDGNRISEAPGYGKEIRLNYQQNNFVISFSSMHFANPLKCRYRYQLMGFDKDWKYTDGKNPTAAYSNLDFDRYTFIVEATNNDGIWSSSRAETGIIITPPWWKSPVAKMIYLALALLVLAGIYFYQARWYRLKREMEIRAINERKKEEMHRQREEFYQQQLMFFTNVSHEFRTPLTLILGPLENLISQNKNSLLDNSYQLMLRNAKRLINLISELMNFKKVADSVVKLQVQPLVIHQFCTELAFEFKELAIGKDIRFTMTDRTEEEGSRIASGPFDVQVLEKILFNLLSNAFKYTDVGGKIDFEIFSDLGAFTPTFAAGFRLLHERYRANKYLYFRVADTGTGISGDSLKNIFDRYYRISQNHLGSGIGLALVKSLTALHKGDIYVYSERHKGTEIIIGIPWGDEYYETFERAAPGTEITQQLEAVDNATLLPIPVHEHEKDMELSKLHKHILLVDDNQELRAFLKQAFDKYYYISEADNGNTAIEIAVEKAPDLIISDVMMPGISGIELCKTIKERFETSHIPFIILSAKDALDSKIDGLASGADFYFAKPLSIDLLLLTVRNIFEQHKKLQLRYTKDYLVEATELVSSEKDKDFLQNFLRLIDEHIQDPELDADFLCERLYISRTKLYQKIKSISDQSVAEFIRTIRLKKAVQIMTHEVISINDVADRIGMQSASNFSRVFKKEYGKSPLQFLQSLKK